MQTSKIFINPIEDIIQNAKRQSTAQALSVNIPSLVQTGQTGTSYYDALVYSVIQVVSFGRSINGTEDTFSKIKGRSIKDWELNALPAPLEIIDLHSANWEGVPLGLMKSGVDASRNLTGLAGINSLLQTLGAGADQITDTNKLSTFLESAIGENVYNAGSIAKGISINPNVELAFRSANLRQIQLQYRLVPLSKNQAIVIENFVNAMKVLMYGSNTYNGNYSAGYIGYPAKFIVKVKAINNRTLFSMGDIDIDLGDTTEKAGCVLTDIQVSYSENGSYAGHYDGSPGFINLNLTFQETTQSTRDSIIKEYGL